MKSTYLSLLSFTDQGARDIRNSPQRATAWKQQAEAAGVTVLAQVWTTGAYDGALILQGDKHQIICALAQLVSLGNVRTHTLQAFDGEEFTALIGQ